MSLQNDFSNNYTKTTFSLRDMMVNVSGWESIFLILGDGFSFIRVIHITNVTR